MKHIVFLSLCIVVLQTALVVAEPAKGRLPDGRAYRTDEQGMELVDYIAELEVTIEEQKRQIHGLQYEVEEKEDVIEALKRNGGTTPEIVEKDLLARQTAREVLAVPLKAKEECPAPVACPQQAACAPCSDTGAAACTARVKTAENQVQALARQNQKLQLDLATQKSLVSHYQAQTPGSAAGAGSVAQVQKLEAALATERAQSKQLLASVGALRAELESVREKEREYQTQLATATSTTRSTVDEISTQNLALRNQNEELQEELQELAGQLEKASEEVEELEAENENVRASAASAVKKAATATKKMEDSTTRASLSTHTLERMRTERSELKTVYNRTRGMAAERDKRYALYRQASDGSVRVRLSELRSERGVPLTEINARISKAQSPDELAKLRGDLQDIKQIIKSDMQLLGRMANR
jgi:chromosome segregation ATPase